MQAREQTHLPWILKCRPPALAFLGYSPSSFRHRSWFSSPFLSPQKAVVAKRLRSNGGAHLLQIPWQAGYVTP
jgi:hypothetical protein